MTNPTIDSDSCNEQSPELRLLAKHLGLAGHQIHKLKDGFLVYRLNLVKYCGNHAELMAFSKNQEF